MDKGVLNRVHGEGRFKEGFDCIDMSIGIQERQKRYQKLIIKV
jgi:hypothetical protein